MISEAVIFFWTSLKCHTAPLWLEDQLQLCALRVFFLTNTICRFLKTALQKTLVKALNSVGNSSSVLQGRQQLLHPLLSVIEGPPVGINDPGYRPDCLTSRLPGSELYLASRLLQTPSPSNHRPTPDYCSIIDSRGLV